jgi:hypothetical protein
MKQLVYRCLVGMSLIVGLKGCQQKVATLEDCQAIFDRIVDIELAEQGFHDPVLAMRRRSDLSRRYQKDIAACVGRTLPPEALECMAQARSTEQLSHRCLK